MAEETGDAGCGENNNDGAYDSHNTSGIDQSLYIQKQINDVNMMHNLPSDIQSLALAAPSIK